MTDKISSVSPTRAQPAQSVAPLPSESVPGQSGAGPRQNMGTLSSLPTRQSRVDTTAGRATRWNGVLVKAKPEDSKKFPTQANEALEKIASKPVGAQLLQEISDNSKGAEAQFGYRVCIQPAASTKEPGLFFRPRNYTGTNVTKAAHEEGAVTPGEGSVSAIRWNPQQTQTPDGERPPFIGLAHELLHAKRNLQGESKHIGPGGTALDEKEVVGLGEHASLALSENKIREEHGISRREKYSGLDSEKGNP
jgi:hypothetical protein